MSYPIAPFPMTLSDFQGHLSIASFLNAIFRTVMQVQLCNRWEDFNRERRAVPHSGLLFMKYE